MKWLSVFPAMDEIHLNKDVVLLPKSVARINSMKEVTLITDSNKTFSTQDGVKIISRVNIALFILKNGKRFQFLHLFHLKWETFFYALLFRLVNFRAKIYIKLDADLHIKNQVSPRAKWWKKPRVPDLIYTVANKLSVETKDIYNFLIQQGWARGKIFLLPNGLDSDVFEFSSTNSNNILREKIILTVGRLGVLQKNTESLIRAYGLLPSDIRKEWKLQLVGSVDIVTKKNLEGISAEVCKAGGEIEFTGLVNNRQDLYRIYKTALIFALPSRWESSGLSLLEACALGCYLVATPVGVAPDLITNNSIGMLANIDDDIDLAEKLKKGITQILSNETTVPEAEVLHWDFLAEALLDNLNE